MAIATLSACYDNHGIFTGVVKIRKGQVQKNLFVLKKKYFPPLTNGETHRYRPCR
jgi:hypothetical protein